MGTDGNDSPSKPIADTPMQTRLQIGVAIAAVVIIMLASLYMVRMPGSLSSMLASMFRF